MTKVRGLFITLGALSLLVVISFFNFYLNSSWTFTNFSELRIEIRSKINCIRRVTSSATVTSTVNRPRAVIVVLTRDSDFEAIYETIVQFEHVFNYKYNYPYVLLNDVEFNHHFRKSITHLIMHPCSDDTDPASTRSVTFGRVPQEHWSYPEWINKTKAQQARAEMERKDIRYGGSESYRFMCRYFSGFFYRHPLLQQYDYYWRLEPGAQYFCDFNYDPFLFMQENKKEYGFVLMMPEIMPTIETLWMTVKKYIKDEYSRVQTKKLKSPVLKPLLSGLPATFRNEYLEKLFSAQDPIDSDYGDTPWPGCHFWSNFEMGSLKFLRSSQYRSYFDYLDQAGGFFYERWGDAPVHTLAAAIFLETWQIHHFNDIGYQHVPYDYQWCPFQKSETTCSCDATARMNFAIDKTSEAYCLNTFLRNFPV